MLSDFSGSLAATLFAGGVPAALVYVALLALRRRHPLMRALGLPLSLVAFGLGVAIANVLGVGDMGRGGGVLVAISWFFVIVMVIRGVLRLRGPAETPVGHRSAAAIAAVTRFFIYAISGATIVTVAFPDANVGPLLATSAVTSLVLGLALQPILTNFFAGVVISLERPFRINDWIQVGEHEGRVTQITWRTTSIRTRQNDTVILPNANMARETLTNYLYPHPLHMSRIYVGAHFLTPPHRVKAAMLAAADQVDGVLDRPSVEVYIHNFDESSITYELRAWIDDMGRCGASRARSAPKSGSSSVAMTSSFRSPSAPSRSPCRLTRLANRVHRRQPESWLVRDPAVAPHSNSATASSWSAAIRNATWLCRTRRPASDICASYGKMTNSAFETSTALTGRDSTASRWSRPY
jgi:small-conductance mechanosensitive channel